MDRNYANINLPGIAGNKDEWETADLTRRLCHALDIARETIGLLATDGFINPDDPANKIVPEKIIGETVFLLFACNVVNPIPGVKQRIDDVAALLIPHARNPKILLKMCLHPALVMEYAQAHVCLKNIGYPDARFDTMLLKSIGAQAHFGRERTPHRMLEQAWIKKTGEYGTLPGPDEISKIIPQSALNRPVDLLHGSRDDLYAFTHALMYVSGFNISPWPMPRDSGTIQSEAQGMLARCLDGQDYDLASEVLLTWPLTGYTWSAAAVFTLMILTKVEDQAGFLPSPATRVQTMEGLNSSDRKKYLYGTAYHTAYVMGLVCSACLQPGRTPPKHIPVNDAAPGSATRVLPFLGNDAVHSHWFEVFTHLQHHQQDALAGLLLDMAIIKNSKLCNYQAVYQLIYLADELRLPDTAVIIQAAELLDRLASYGL